MKKYLLTLLLTLLLFGSFQFTHGNASTQHIEIPYAKQSEITCNDISFSTPIFPVKKNKDLFLQIDKKQCSTSHFSMSINIGKQCNGAHICQQHFFSKNQIDYGHLNSALHDIFENSPETITLSNNIKGYFIPQQVYSYPTALRLVWISNDYIYIIGTKSENKDYLITIVNSFISKKKQ